MKLSVLLLLISCIIVSCNTDEKAAEIILRDVTFGAVIKTKQINSDEFNIFDTQSRFSVEIEIQDEEDGGFFERIEVFATFLDRTPEGGTNTSQETLLRTLTPDMFFTGPDLLPRFVFETTFEELLGTTQTSINSVSCKDQYLLRMQIHLEDGRVFGIGTATSDIIAFDTFFSSPYCYTINIVEPIEPDSFTGQYFYESILDGFFGPTFLEPRFVTLVKGRNDNLRYVALRQAGNSKNSPNYEFTIACDQSIFQKNQLLGLVCGPSTDPEVLLGPDTVYATINPNDDSVFEVYLVEGYLGWDGQCGFGTVPSRIRFTKQ